jgi:LAO/AO transport system kinase
MDLGPDVQAGKRRAIARAITMVEAHDAAAPALLRSLHAATGNAHVIGMTGSPGTGKSTLTDKLIVHYRQQGLRVAVVAVDPSSPFSGGAILGDRIRMQSRSTDEDVYIRSMGTRGALGGLASSTGDAVKVLDAAGFDIIIVETVGVGQAEVDVIRLADTVCVVLVPGMGDDVQAVKAGVMEIADIFVVNKSDLDGSDKVHAEVEAMQMLGHPDEDDFWWVPICRTVGDKATGVPELAQSIGEHAAWSRRTGNWEKRRERRLWAQVRDLLERTINHHAFESNGMPRAAFAEAFLQAQDGSLSPQDVAQRIIADFATQA